MGDCGVFNKDGVTGIDNALLEPFEGFLGYDYLANAGFGHLMNKLYVSGDAWRDEGDSVDSELD